MLKVYIYPGEETLIREADDLADAKRTAALFPNAKVRIYELGRNRWGDTVETLVTG